MVKRSTVVRALLTATAVSALPVSAANFDVTQGLWGDAGTANSFAWAIHQANTTPGADVITLFSDVNVDNAPITNVSGFLTEITDTAGLTIHTLVGNPLFAIDITGELIDKKAPKPYRSDATSLLIPAFSFARISKNVANVTINQLTVDGLNAFLDVDENSVATVTNSTIRYSVSWPRTPRSAITAKPGSTVNLTDVTMHNLNPFDERSADMEYSTAGSHRPSAAMMQH